MTNIGQSNTRKSQSKYNKLYIIHNKYIYKTNNSILIMIKEKERIPKLILTPDSIELQDSGWRLSTQEQLTMCNNCHSNLFYIEPRYGIIVEEFDGFGVMYYKEDRQFRLTEIGLSTYCAECGCYNEGYYKYFYPEDKVIMTFEDLNDVEGIEINHCLNQYNQNHDFKPSYQLSETRELKEKLDKYIKEHPIKKETKTKKRKVKK